MVMALLQRLGRATLEFLVIWGRAGNLLLHSLAVWPSLQGLPLLVKQIHFVGVLSLVIILVSGLFIGMVLGLQGYTILSDFGTTSAVGQLVALSLTRELAPVVTALLFAGRAGSALTAEIGLMKATEQLASMEMIGVDPLRRIIAPRLLAGFISLPLLTMIFCMVGVWGGKLVAVDWLGLHAGTFWSTMQANVSFRDDVVNGLLKSLAFAFVVVWIAVVQGYECLPTSEGISRATTKTVVFSSLAVLGIDFILTAVMFGNL